jgi:hypothetical protein
MHYSVAAFLFAAFASCATAQASRNNFLVQTRNSLLSFAASINVQGMFVNHEIISFGAHAKCVMHILYFYTKTPPSLKIAPILSDFFMRFRE